MRRFWVFLIVVILGTPSLAFLAFTGAEQFLSCQMNPYAGFARPAIFAYLMPLAALGIITIIPFLAVLTIWLMFEIIKTAIRRKTR